MFINKIEAMEMGTTYITYIGVGEDHGWRHRHALRDGASSRYRSAQAICAQLGAQRPPVVENNGRGRKWTIRKMETIKDTVVILNSPTTAEASIFVLGYLR